MGAGGDRAGIEVEAQLHRGAARYESLVRASLTDVWWADADGQLLGDLPAWRDHTGQSLEEFLGSGWLEAVRGDQRAAVAEAWQEAVANRTRFEREFAIVSPKGAERVVAVRALPVARRGDPFEWLGTATSVDHRPSGNLALQARMADTLQGVSAALVSELDLERVVDRVTEAATHLIGAEFGAFFYNVVEEGGIDDARESYMLYALAGAPREAFADFPMPRNTALFGPTFTGEGLVRLDDVTADPRYGQNPPFFGMPPGHLPVRSYLAVPVVSRTGDVLGGLFFGHARPGVFSEEHERLVVGIAGPAAIAIDNARLFRAAQREREAAERVARRLGQLQSVSARLAGAKVVDEVAEVVMTGAAAALECTRTSLFLLDDHGEYLRLAHAFGFEGELSESWRRIPRNAALPVADALRARRLVIVADDEDWARRYPDVAASSRRSTALAAIPLALGRQAFGVAAFGWDNPRVFTDDEAQFLEALADQCSQALERARLYELERETARTLQRSLLPPRTPEIPGMDVAAEFRAGDRTVAVGGDFFDVFRIGPNRWGVAMGDVCGRGARAASRTALVRYTLRAVAGRNDGPAKVLHALNDLVQAGPDDDDRFCATVFGHVELDRCGAWVTLACAGHPRPVVIRRAGWIDLRGQPGTLIGVVDRLELSEDRVGLGPGDALVFFTDGITEARNRAGEQFADEALPRTLLGCTQLDARTIARRVRRAALEFSGGSLGDDLAVLVVRVPPEAADDPDGRITAALGPDAADEVPGYPVPEGGRDVRPLPPREARIVLPPHPVSAGAARRFLTAVLNSWRMPELVEEGQASLLLSELATNAILHARSSFTVTVRYDGSSLRVEVGDESPEPARLLYDVDDFSQTRGLYVVDRTASRWGTYPGTDGKYVWFELPAGDG